MSDARAQAVMPVAAALVCAVADGDAESIEEILNGNTLDWQALAVVLAGNIDIDSPLAKLARVPPSPDAVVDHCLVSAAVAFGVTSDAILSADRHRPVLDARAVAMAACRLAGLSSTFIGHRFSRDHSTVLHAASRVGESPRLRRITNRIASPLGIDVLEAVA